MVNQSINAFEYSVLPKKQRDKQFAIQCGNTSLICFLLPLIRLAHFEGIQRRRAIQVHVFITLRYVAPAFTVKQPSLDAPYRLDLLSPALDIFLLSFRLMYGLSIS